MSLKSTSGTSLTEVMVMMVILGISIVGIYSMVHSGRELANLTNQRLTGINIAREGLESVATLRDTFALKGYESGACGLIASGFFSIDEEILVDSPVNCPQTGETYILDDDKKLTISADVEVCINEFGWYSQEYSVKNGAIGTCGVVGDRCPCADTTALCGGDITQSCKTRFTREITFAACTFPTDLEYCVNVTSTVSWGSEPDDMLELSQILTPLD